MRRIAAVLALLFAAPLLGACNNSNDFFENKPAPDEFAVYSRAPLALPPDFSLRPPAPGSMRPQNVNPTDKAQEALRSSTVTAKKPASARPVAGSAGVQTLLRDTGGLNADPEIRATINRESASFVEENTGFTDKVMFWTKGKKSKGAAYIVNPEEEARRIKNNQAQGRPLNAPAPKPRISRSGTPDKSKGFWSSLF